MVNKDAMFCVLRKSDGGCQGERRILPLTLIIALAITGCASYGPMTTPAGEIEGLLFHHNAAGLSREQSASLRVLLERSEAGQRALERHLSHESRELDRHVVDRPAAVSPAFWARLGLIHQLRAERLLATVALRQQALAQLTDEQREWFYEQRLRLIFPP